MERFFQESSKIDYEEIIDLLLSRYSNIDFIMRQDIETALRIIKKAKEKEEEKRYFIQWAVQLPFMTKDNYISFNDYIDKVTGRNIDTRSTAECMAEIEEVKQSFAKGG